MFTDGLSQDSVRTGIAARLLKQSGPEIFTVSLDSGDVDPDELYRIASSARHRYRLHSR